MHWWHRLLLFNLFIFLYGCSKNDGPYRPIGVESNLSVEEAKDIISVAYGEYPGSRGCIGRYILGYKVKHISWEDAIKYHCCSSGQDVVEVPFISDRQVRFLSWKNTRTAELLDSSEKIIIVKDSFSKTGVFFMTVVADREYTRRHPRIVLSDEIHNDGIFGDFSGVIIYSRISGTIVRADRYEEGELVKEASIYSLSEPYGSRLWGKMLASVMGSLSVADYHNYVKTRSGSVDSLDGWWNGDTTAIDIEGSICVADTTAADDPFDPFSDLDNGDPFAGGGYTGPDEPDPGSGGGGGGGSTGQNSPTTSQYAGITIYGGTPTQISYLLRAFTDNRVNTYAPVVRLLNELNKSKVCILIQSQVEVNGTSVDAACNPPNASGRIIIKVNANELDNVSYCWAIYEELFHAYQYQTSPSWKKGDMELEAKVWISILKVETGVHFGIDDVITNIMSGFFYDYMQNYYTYSDADFSQVLTALRTNPFWYSEDGYPITSNMQKVDRLKHIKSIY